MGRGSSPSVPFWVHTWGEGPVPLFPSEFTLFGVVVWRIFNVNGSSCVNLLLVLGKIFQHPPVFVISKSLSHGKGRVSLFVQIWRLFYPEKYRATFWLKSLSGSWEEEESFEMIAPLTSKDRRLTHQKSWFMIPNASHFSIIFFNLLHRRTWICYI